MIHEYSFTTLMAMGLSLALFGCGDSSTTYNSDPDIEYMSLSNISATPGDGSTGISTSAAIRVFINHDINQATLNNNGFVLMGTSPVTGDITYIPANREMIFIPDEPMQAYTLYRATFTTELADVDGLHLETDLSWTFTTGPDIIRISRDSNGVEGNNHSYGQDISTDGNIIAFYSIADNLVQNDTNSQGDIFVYNDISKETIRISLNTDGSERLAASTHPVLSDDGRFVAFRSNGYFIHDIENGITSRIDTPDPLATGSTTYPVIEDYPALSSDGRYVAFQSAAGNLTLEDTRTTRDIFLRDTLTNGLSLVSVSTDETQANHHSYSPSISSDGRYVAFSSPASNLVNDDTNGVSDIFVRDMVNGTTTRASVAAAGIIQANGHSGNPVISANGQIVAFTSEATNLVPNDTNDADDVFVYNYSTGITRRVSVDSSGTEANYRSALSDMTSDGRYIAFTSSASNWGQSVPAISNAGYLYVHDTVTGNTKRLPAHIPIGGIYPAYGRKGTTSSNGLFITYANDDPYLDGRDNNFSYDVFRVSLQEP